MKILVINEPFVKNFCRTQRWAARTRGRVLRPPDWLAYATAVLESNGYNVKLYDFPAEDWDKNKLPTLIKQEQPDIVVLDSTTPSIYSDIDCARIVKAEAHCIVIMVGPHVTALPDETLSISKGNIDIVCRGEYDYTILDIVRTLEKNGDLSQIQGISYYRQGNIFHTPNRPLISNLDELPFPAWHHLNIMKYFDGGKLYPYMDIISGRGCPFGCIFCLWPQVMHGRRYRLRSAKNVVNEIEYDLKNWPSLKNGEIFFEDDTFTVNKERAIEICQEIKNRHLKFNWSVNSRVDCGDLELFKQMKDAGCRLLLVGFENGNQNMLNLMNKKITLDNSKEFVKKAHQAGLVVHGCFVLGLPGETRQTLEETIQFALSLNVDTIQFSAAIPFPGTEFYNMCKEKDFINAKSWSDWLDEGEQTTIVNYPDLSSQDISYYVDKGLRKFYFRPFYIIKFLLNTKSKSDLYRKIRGFINFVTYLLESKK